MEKEVLDQEILDEDDIEDEVSGEEPPFTIGDSVVVKPGVEDPDGNGDLSGWQARVVGFDERDPHLLELEWDSVTLQGMTLDQLMTWHVEGQKWWMILLEAEDLALATPRDTEEDVARVKDEIEARIDEEDEITGMLYGEREHGRNVLALVKQMPTHDVPTVREVWHTYLQTALKLPFIADLYDDTHRPWRRGDRVTVRAITRHDPAAGTIVRVEHKRLGSREFPLDALDIPTKTAANYELLSEYIDWRDERSIHDRPGMEHLKEMREIMNRLDDKLEL